MKASNEFEKAILNYLKAVQNNYPNLPEALVNEGKTITDCCNYIIQEVKKKKVVAMADDEVFTLARDYYLSEKTKVEKASCKVVVGADKSTASKINKEAAEKKIPAVDKLEPKAKKVKEEKPADGNQLSLFEDLFK
jgi:hypothetical protein